MRRGRLHRLACLLFGCNFIPIEIWSAPPKRLVLLCSRCLDSKTLTPGRELSEEMARANARGMARAYVQHLN